MGGGSGSLPCRVHDAVRWVAFHDLPFPYPLPPSLQVVEFWASSPGDGATYFVMRPPWLRPDRITTYYTLHPEVRRTGASLRGPARLPACPPWLLPPTYNYTLHPEVRDTGLE